MNDQQHSRADALTDEQLDAALAEFELAMEADPRNTDYARNSPTWPRVARAIRKDALYAAILAASPVEQHEAAPAHKRCVGWAILNGVCVVDFSRDGAQARSMAREMQRSHDLSGSLAAFHVEPVFIVTGGAEGVRAWETDDGRVISNEQKQQAIRDGGASASSVRPYAHALGRVVPAQAAKPVAVPAGWKLVPVAPTPEMCCAMEEAIDAGWKDSVVWARGIAAAPQPPAPTSAPVELTDEQREAIEYAAHWLEENVSNRYAYTAVKQLRALLKGDKQ
ncbi:hypothetical protein [Burkholderia multivorans]|uniref:hypothetical protein n=1 Tax=Burkholderia multivorans TaxID=87883 RepID=UPI001FC854E5|nr:hypothetical protein [Burkholderia multivorans]